MRNTLIIADPSERVRREMRQILGEQFQILETSETAPLTGHDPGNLAAVILGFSLISPAAGNVFSLSADFDDIPVFVIIDAAEPDQEADALSWGADHVVRYPFRADVVSRTILNTIALYNNKWSLERIVEEQKTALSNSKDILVDTLSTIIEYRSVESGQHVRRLRSFTSILLQEVSRCCPEYNLDERTISEISNAAALHDIGKISIPDAILNKPGRLTPEEFEIMKTHAAAGSEIIERMAGMGNEEYLRYAYNICRYHHERWDGSGYPNGLQGEAIPICAQVVGLTDAYDALTTKRVYKDACSASHAVNMILNGECGVFSPKLLECFKHVCDDFSRLAEQYADGEAIISERIREPLAPPGRTAANTLQEIMSKYEILLQHVASLVIEIDLDNNIIHSIYNPDPTFDYLQNARTPDHAMQMLAENAVHPDDRVLLTDMFGSYLEMFLASGLKKSVRRYRMKDYDGVYRTCNAYSYRLDENSRKILGIWEKETDASTNISLDSLTQLFNKETAQRLTEELLAGRASGHLSAFVIIDLDNFKNINDRYGHLFGDEVLALISQKLSSLFRSTDVVARIGGDEFLVFMPNIPNVDLILNRCNTLIDTIPEIFEGQLRDSGLACSIGIALAPEHGTLYQDLFRHADTALYRAKHLGKNRCIVYESMLQMPAYPSPVSQRIDSDEHPQWTENNLPSYAFDLLYESGDMEATINHLLSIVGEQTHAARVYIFENNADNTACSNTFEWCREGISAEKDNLQDVSYITDIPGYDKNFNEQGIFYCFDVNNQPEHIRMILEPQGVRSMLQCAIRDNGIFKGYVGFDDDNPRLWTKEQINVLTFLSRIISIFVLKHRVQEATSQMLEDMRHILNHQYAWLYIIDPDTYKIRFFNKRTQNLIPDISGDSVCYKKLLGRDTPCENCPIRQNGRVIIENRHLGLTVESAASPIHWEGKPEWLITCRELEQ